MTVGPTSASPSRNWWQFSLRALLLLMTNAAITSGVCLTLYRWGLRAWPIWLVVFFVAWTATVLGLMMVSVVMVIGLVDDSSRRDGRLRGALVWACLPALAWLAFAGSLAIPSSLGSNERDLWLSFFGVTMLHLSLVAVPVSIRMRREGRREADQPLVILRLLCIASSILPAVATLLSFFLPGPS